MNRKEEKHSPRALARIAAFSTLALAIAVGFAVKNGIEAKKYADYIEHSYQRSFFALASGIGAIDIAMEKGLYSNSPAMMSRLAAEVARESAGAADALCQLPFAFHEMENTSKFIGQAGDFSNSLAAKAASGAQLSEEDVNNMKQMSAQAKTLSANLYRLQTIISEEGLSIGEAVEQERDMDKLGKAGAKLFGDSFKDVESEFSAIPSLVYDGPFSEHLNKTKPALLNGKSEIDEEQARANVENMFGLTEGTLKLSHETGGKVPCYSFRGSASGGEFAVDVSKQGGFAVNMMLSRANYGEHSVSPEDAAKKAKAFLDKIGIKNMRADYWEVIGDIALVNFQYKDGDAVCYPDLIKVGVALDTGEVERLECMGYIMSHKDKRDLGEPAVTKAEAQAKVSKSLTVKNAQMCVVPSEGGDEVVCWEFDCKDAKNKHVIVYIDANTGAEERIMILLESPNGTLSI